MTGQALARLHTTGCRTLHSYLTLVLGGARSGKSRYAEGLITATPPPWIYVATAQAQDAEMAERIAHHRTRRGAGWHTIEAPHDLADAIDAAPAGAAVLVDCLTLWLTNRMLAERRYGGRDRPPRGRPRRVAAGRPCSSPTRSAPASCPTMRLRGGFRDLQGRLNQRLAARADRVVLVVAGLPLIVKGQA